jgi:hypothetical protein
VSLGCPFLISPSVFFNVYNKCHTGVKYAFQRSSESNIAGRLYSYLLFVTNLWLQQHLSDEMFTVYCPWRILVLPINTIDLQYSSTCITNVILALNMPSNAVQRVILLQSTEKEYIIVSNGPYKRHRGQYFYTVPKIGGEFTLWYNAPTINHILLA